MKQAYRQSILILLLGLVHFPFFKSIAQETSIELDLLTTVQLANDSSLSAFRAKNSYMASYWEYRSFKADRLPSLSLYLTPVSYNRDYTAGMTRTKHRYIPPAAIIYSFGNWLPSKTSMS